MAQSHGPEPRHSRMAEQIQGAPAEAGDRLAVIDVELGPLAV